MQDLKEIHNEEFTIIKCIYCTDGQQYFGGGGGGEQERERERGFI